MRNHDLRTKFINSFEACRVSFLNLESSKFRWGFDKKKYKYLKHESNLPLQRLQSRMSKVGSDLRRQVTEAWLGFRGSGGGQGSCPSPNTGGSAGSGRSPSKAPTISRNIDQELNEIMTNLYRDYVDYWLKGIRATSEELQG